MSIGATCSGSVRIAHSSLDGLVGNLDFLVAGRPVLLRDDCQSSKFLELIIGGGGAATESINGLRSGVVAQCGSAQRTGSCTTQCTPQHSHKPSPACRLSPCESVGCAGEGRNRLVIEEVTAQWPNRCRVVDGDTRALDQEVGSHVVLMLEAAVVRTHRVRC